MITKFSRPEDSHRHSLTVLNLLYEYDDFMESVGTVLDLGCGSGLDLEWWATRTTRDLNNPKPLNIRCTGIDLQSDLPLAKKYKNIGYQSGDFEQPIPVGQRKYDILWCHDAFQYVLDPFSTLKRWHDVTSTNGMLIITVPQTTNLEFNKQSFEQADYTYYHWTLVSLIHILAVTGWDVSLGHFRKEINDPWIHAVVYKSENPPLDPRRTSWYDLAEQGMLPESASQSVNRWGYLRQQDLVLSWLDRSLQWFGSQ